jgi:hypothetical protein
MAPACGGSCWELHDRGVLPKVLNTRRDQHLQEIFHRDTRDCGQGRRYRGRKAEGFIGSQCQYQPCDHFAFCAFVDISLNESISHYRQCFGSLLSHVNFVQVMDSGNGKYWLGRISADHVFATCVHRLDDPHMRSYKVH